MVDCHGLIIFYLGNNEEKKKKRGEGGQRGKATGTSHTRDEKKNQMSRVKPPNGHLKDQQGGARQVAAEILKGADNPVVYEKLRKKG